MFRKVLIWFGGMLLFSLAGYILTAWVTAPRTSAREPFKRSVAMFEFNEAIRAYENGGTAGLKEYIARLDKGVPADHHLLNAAGKDLATGEDRTEALARATQITPGFRWTHPRHL